MKKEKNENKLFNSLKKGLEESLDFSKSNSKVKLKQTSLSIPELPSFKGKEIKSIRNKLNLSQAMFANTLGVSEKTVEAWESGRNIPQGPAQRMLFVLKNNSNALYFLGIKAG